MNRKPKIPDFPFMIQKLVDDGGSLQKLADEIGTHRSTLSQIKNEVRPISAEWLASYYLLDIYIRKYGTPIPFYGEHNE